MFFYGFAMQSRGLITGWLIYKLTGSSLSLGWYIGTWGVAAFLLSFIGGTICDRFSLQRVIIIARAVAGVGLAGILVLAALGRLGFLHLLIFNLVNGAVAAFEYPARTAIVPKLVPQEEFTSAFGLSYTAQNLSFIIGPAMIGPILDNISPTAALLVTTLAMLLSVLCMAPVRRDHGQQAASVKRVSLAGGLVDGLKHVRAQVALMAVEGFLLIYVLMLMPYRDLLPAIAADVLRVSATGLGLLSSANNLGALLGTVIVSSLGQMRRRGLLFLVAALLEGIGLLLFARSSIFGLSLMLLGIAGLGHGFFIPLSNTLLQAYAAPEMRARVIGVNMFVWSLQPLGTIALGAIADDIGPGRAVFISAVLAVVIFVGGLSLSKRMRELA
jgi:MFS family permease